MHAQHGTASSVLNPADIFVTTIKVLCRHLTWTKEPYSVEARRYSRQKLVRLPESRSIWHSCEMSCVVCVCVCLCACVHARARAHNCSSRIRSGAVSASGGLRLPRFAWFLVDDAHLLV